MNVTMLFAFACVLVSEPQDNVISSNIDCVLNYDLTVNYGLYNFYYEDNKSIELYYVDSVELDCVLNITNNVYDLGGWLGVDSGGTSFHLEIDMNSEGYFRSIYRDNRDLILKYKYFHTMGWFESSLEMVNFQFIGNSYSIVPHEGDSTIADYEIIGDVYLALEGGFDESSYYSLDADFLECFTVKVSNLTNVGMGYIVEYEELGDTYVNFYNNDSYFNYIYNVGNENGLFQGRQEGYRTGYDDAIMSQPSSVLELVTKPFVEMGKFLNISIAPNLTLGMIIAIPIVVAIIGFLIKALIA